MIWGHKWGTIYSTLKYWAIIRKWICLPSSVYVISTLNQQQKSYANYVDYCEIIIKILFYIWYTYFIHLIFWYIKWSTYYLDFFPPHWKIRSKNKTKHYNNKKTIILIEVSSFRNRQPYLVSIVRNICDWCFFR